MLSAAMEFSNNFNLPSGTDIEQTYLYGKVGFGL